jgi:hypothetical protein
MEIFNNCLFSLDEVQQQNILDVGKRRGVSVQVPLVLLRRVVLKHVRQLAAGTAQQRVRHPGLRANHAKHGHLGPELLQ